MQALQRRQKNNYDTLTASSNPHLPFPAGYRYNAICSIQENRGLVVQQGGIKALLGLAAEGTEKGKVMAAQALARIAITINPEVSFPGHRVSVGCHLQELAHKFLLIPSFPGAESKRELSFAGSSA